MPKHPRRVEMKAFIQWTSSAVLSTPPAELPWSTELPAGTSIWEARPPIPGFGLKSNYFLRYCIARDGKTTVASAVNAVNILKAKGHIDDEIFKMLRGEIDTSAKSTKVSSEREATGESAREIIPLLTQPTPTSGDTLPMVTIPPDNDNSWV